MELNKNELQILINALETDINSKEIDAVRIMKSLDREKVIKGEILHIELKSERKLLDKLKSELHERKLQDKLSKVWLKSYN